MRLLFIHLAAILAVGLSIYYPGLDILMALLYLVVVAAEAFRFSQYSAREQIMVALLWQAPAWFLTVVNLLQVTDIASYSIFILQLWYTPLIGLLSLPGLPVVDEKPLYYYLTLLMPVIMSSYYFLFTQVKIKNLTPDGD